MWTWLHEGKTVQNIDSRAELKAMADIGADGIFTDRPRQLMHELR